jgi:hypothetical protein
MWIENAWLEFVLEKLKYLFFQKMALLLRIKSPLTYNQKKLNFSSSWSNMFELNN